MARGRREAPVVAAELKPLPRRQQQGIPEPDIEAFSAAEKLATGCSVAILRKERGKRTARL
jgi:hypothetical protein